MKDKFEQKVYAAYLRDYSLLDKSSSGGMFTAISDVFLSNNDGVVCAVFNYESKMTEYKLITSDVERDSARGSKYVQSIMGDILFESKEWLLSNPDKKLVFFGMGCQAAGFMNYMKTQNLEDRILTVDIICHGSPSPKLWKEYTAWLENKTHSKISYITFKDKRNGWKKPFPYVIIGKKEIAIRDYVKIFYNKCALRPACHKCAYTTTERNTDITIGDYWGIDKVMPEFYNSKGNSLVLIHSFKGQQIFEATKENIVYKDSSIEDCLQPNLVRPTEKSRCREEFWNEYKQFGVKYIVEKYGKVSTIQKIKDVVRKFGGGYLANCLSQSNIAFVKNDKCAELKNSYIIGRAA